MISSLVCTVACTFVCATTISLNPKEHVNGERMIIIRIKGIIPFPTATPTDPSNLGLNGFHVPNLYKQNLVIRQTV